MIRARPPLFDTGRSNSKFLAVDDMLSESTLELLAVLCKVLLLILLLEKVVLVAGTQFERLQTEEVCATIAKTLFNEWRKSILRIILSIFYSFFFWMMEQIRYRMCVSLTTTHHYQNSNTIYGDFDDDLCLYWPILRFEIADDE